MRFTARELGFFFGRVFLVALLASITATVVGLACPAKAWKPPSLAERAIVEHAIRYSPTARPHNKDPFTMLEVLRLEEHPDITVPDEFRGMSLAVSYRESRWSPGVVGDGGKAVGWTQMHSALHRACGRFDRTSPQGNMRCWLWRVRVTYDSKVYSRCVRREGYTARDAWIAAWRWVASGRWQGCEAGEPRLHLAQLLCWSEGQRHSGVCRGRRGGWKRDLRRHVEAEGLLLSSHGEDIGEWHAHE